MKKCSDCNVEMIEETNIHTDYVGGITFEEQIYITYVDGISTGKNLLGKEKEKKHYTTERVKARICPNCKK